MCVDAKGFGPLVDFQPTMQIFIQRKKGDFTSGGFMGRYGWYGEI